MNFTSFSKKIQKNYCNCVKTRYNIKAMLRNTVVDRFNINVVDYTDYFLNSVVIDIVDELYDLGITVNDSNIFSKDITRAISHHLIKSICSIAIDYNNSTEQLVFFINTTNMSTSELSDYVDKPLQQLVVELFDRLNGLVGIKYISTNNTFDDFIDNINSRDGDTLDTLASIKQNKPHNLFKLKKYIDTHGLTQLGDEFFNKHSMKQVII